MIQKPREVTLLIILGSETQISKKTLKNLLRNPEKGHYQQKIDSETQRSDFIDNFRLRNSDF